MRSGSRYERPVIQPKQDLRLDFFVGNDARLACGIVVVATMTECDCAPPVSLLLPDAFVEHRQPPIAIRLLSRASDSAGT